MLHYNSTQMHAEEPKLDSRVSPDCDSQWTEQTDRNIKSMQTQLVVQRQLTWKHKTQIKMELVSGSLVAVHL